jgi:hypothetical protein
MSTRICSRPRKILSAPFLQKRKMAEDQTVYEKVRCAAHNKNGARCKRNTIIYAKYCWQHARKEVGVNLEQSKIPHAGRGLFAARDLPANTRISYARAQDFLTEAELTARYGHGLAQYGICNPAETICADARSTQSGLGRWVNHRASTEKRQTDNRSTEPSSLRQRYPHEECPSRPRDLRHLRTTLLGT